MAKRWRKEDVAYIKRYAAKRSLEDLAARFKTDADQVREKLIELKRRTKDSQGYQEPWVDPGLTHFEAGVEAVAGQKWAAARKHLNKVLETAEQTDIKARARQYLAVCEAQQEAGGGKTGDAYLEAVMAKNRGDLDAAMELCDRSGRRSKDERFAYLASSIRALEGAGDESLDLLRRAIDLNPENRVHAYHDSDFDAVRGQQGFQELFEAS